ncbi:DUF1819 family protein [Geotoga petraea]|uniref:Putative inner membrane protein n=1 Tax=Geotoga petraea TaxID=28234 RepID=A0A1G6MMY6_9BACT|nr:DUF1819 family protein [Geotoga petraea]SDC56335.1 Putative inner membrane protein [Geotoga petraea]
MKRYTAGLTGAPFLFYETNRCFELLNQGLSIDEIKQKVLEENIFNYKKTTSLRRSFTGIKKRLEMIDDELLEIYINSFTKTKKQIIFYLITKNNLILLDFLNEILANKIKTGDYEILQKDFNKYFNYKSEQYPEVAKWTEKTKQKLISVMKKILFEIEIVTDKKYTKIQKINLDFVFEEYLEKQNEKEFLYFFKVGD